MNTNKCTNEFALYHPVVNFTYFVVVIGASMFFMHPACLVISLLCAFVYSCVLKGSGAIKKNLLYILPLMILTALINPLVNHMGVTVIEYLPDNNPLTLESVVYGGCAAMMLASVISWFSCYNSVMTSDKFISLFAKPIPALSLVISMTLRFVPRFFAHMQEVVNAQKSMGKDAQKGIVQKVKNGLGVLSTMTTWALENATETADSMKARGYGIEGRTNYKNFKFSKRDLFSLMFIVLLGMYVICGACMGCLDFEFFPQLKMANITPYGISVFVVYFLLCVYPLIIEAKEAIRWKLLRSKI